jgi:hypothetical protein
MIAERDLPILRAFLERESLQFMWGMSSLALDYRLKFVDRMLFDIASYNPSEAFDYVRIESMTNAGLVDAALILSCKPWKHGVSMLCLLPPSPKGSVSFSKTSMEVL